MYARLVLILKKITYLLMVRSQYITLPFTLLHYRIITFIVLCSTKLYLMDTLTLISRLPRTYTYNFNFVTCMVFFVHCNITILQETVDHMVLSRIFYLQLEFQFCSSYLERMAEAHGIMVSNSHSRSRCPN